MEICLQIVTFGSFAVYRGEQAIADKSWGTHRAKSLLKLLLANHGLPLTKEQVIECLWVEASPEAAQRDLYTAVSELRRILEPALAKPANSAYILSTDSGYRFNLASPHTLDKTLFEQQIALAQNQVKIGALETALAAYAQAESYYRGDFLAEDLYSDWSTHERERLRLLFLSALLESAEIHARLGRYRQAIARCRRALDLDNCLEEAYRALILYYAASGDRAQAMRVYIECQTTLQRELNVDPSPATHKLIERVRTAKTESPAPHYAPPPPPVLPFSLSQMPFVGRATELAQFRRLTNSGAAPNGGVLLVVGESGIGKSELVAHALHGASLLRAQCHELTQGLPYHGLVTILRQALQSGALTLPAVAEQLPDWNWVKQLTHLMPELGKAGSVYQPPDTKQLLFDAFVRAFRAITADALIQIEDLQWVDDNTLEFIAYAGPSFTNGLRWLIATARPDERLLSLRSHVHRLGWLSEIVLKPLSEAEIMRLTETLSPTQHEMRSLGSRLFRAIGGNPLFVVNVLLSLFETGRLWRDADGIWGGIDELLNTLILPVPDAVKTLVERRMDGLTSSASRLLRLAAVLDDPLDFELLVAILPKAFAMESLAEATLLDGIDELLHADLLSETATGGLRFSHDAFREAAYAQLSPPRREWLHQCAGEVLEQRSSNEIVRLAYHFGRSADADKAIRYLVEAGDAARYHYANRQALLCYQNALKFIKNNRAHAQDWQSFHFKAVTGLASVAYDLALVELEQAAIEELKQLLPTVQGEEQIDATIRLAYLLSDTERYADVIELTDALLPQLNATHPWRSHLITWRVRGYAFWEHGQAREMLDCFEHCLAIARENVEPRGHVSSWIFVGLAYSYLGEWDQALVTMAKVEEFYSQVTDPYITLAVDEVLIEFWSSLGAWQAAHGALSRALEATHALETNRYNAFLSYWQGLLATQCDAEQAVAHFELALKQARMQRKRSLEGSILTELALLAAKREDWIICETLFQSASTLFLVAHSQMKLTYLTSQAMLVFLKADKLAVVAHYATLAETAPYSKVTPLLCFAQGQFHLAIGDVSQGTALVAQARQALHEQAQRIADPQLRAGFLAHPQNQMILEASHAI